MDSSPLWTRFATWQGQLQAQKWGQWAPRKSLLVVYLAFPRGEVAERRRRRFAKAATSHETGLKFTISGPFFIGTLVGVGCGMMVLGPRFGTLLGTLEPMPMCAYQAHIMIR